MSYKEIDEVHLSVALEVENLPRKVLWKVLQKAFTNLAKIESRNFKKDR